MKKGQDLVLELPQLVVIHQKIPGREVGQHSHKEHELFLPLQGEIRVYGDGFDVSAGAGKMLYVPPRLDHRFSSSAHGEGERVILLLGDSLWKKCGGGVHDPSSLSMNALIRELVFFLLLNPTLKPASSRAFIEALTRALAQQLDSAEGRVGDMRISDIESKIGDKRVKAAVNLLRNVEAQPSVAELARKSGLSTRNLSRVFQAEVGMTPKQFAIVAKMEAAKHQLNSTRKTVTDISLDVGYNSLSKFIAAFQNHTGQLPSEYRNRG